MASTKLIKTTYKALLKTARRLDAALPVGAPLAVALAQLGAPAAPTFFDATRRAFRPIPAPPAATGIDAAFVALREANKLATAFEAPPPPVSHAAFRVGQVFRHRQLGYRAIIVARDETCQASARWVSSTGAARLPRGTGQPYYTALVDVRDRPDAAVSYVAEDNVGLLVHGDEALVVHPLLSRHFATDAGARLIAEVDGGGEPTPSGAGKAMAV